MDLLSLCTRFYIMENASHLPEAACLLGTSSPASLSQFSVVTLSKCSNIPISLS